MRHKYFQIGIIGVVFLYFAFCILFQGQDWMKRLYYFIMPLSFLLMTVGYPYQNSLIRVGRNTLVITVIYNLLKLIGVIEYNYDGTKIAIPSVVFISIIYQLIKDHYGNVSFKQLVYEVRNYAYSCSAFVASLPRRFKIYRTSDSDNRKE